RHAARVARAIIEARRAGPVETTGKLAAIVARALPRHEHGKNPATRTFQALRITINDELGELERFLAVAADCLRPPGRRQSAATARKRSSSPSSSLMVMRSAWKVRVAGFLPCSWRGSAR